MDSTRRKPRLFGLPIDNLTMSEAVAEIENLIRKPGPKLVFTPNTQHISLLASLPEFRAAYAAADLVLPDSVPLIWSSRLLGCPLRERVAGADLPGSLGRVAARQGYSLFFLGAAPGVGRRAAEILTAAHPGLRVAGVYAPPRGFELRPELDEEAVRRIRAARPDILFVALGTPKGELWAWRHRDDAGVPVTICCGAALDFLAGSKKRAPAPIQKLGLEWLYRVLHEPRRLWRRYLFGNSHFVFLAAKELLKGNRKTAGGGGR